MRHISYGLLAAALGLTGCTGTRTPSELAAAGPDFQYSSPASAETIRNCLLPKLDNLSPFALEPLQRRPALVRPLATGIQIFAQDGETITLYVIELTQGPRGANIAATSSNSRMRGLIDAEVQSCGGKKTSAV